MKRVLLLVPIVLLVLSGCSSDPCTFDKQSPSCAVSQSQAQATIGAIDADRFLKGTQSAIMITRQADKSVAEAQSTRQAVNAEGTLAAMNIEATKAAIESAKKQSAVIYQSTQTFVDAEATKVFVQVGGTIERANAERAAVPYNAMFNVVVFWFLIPALLVGLLVVYGQSTVKRVTEAAAAAVTKRAATVTYGPANDPRIGFLTFDPKTGQPQKFITSDGMIGNFADLLTGGTVLDQLDVPQQMKLAALVEASKRTTAAHISAATGTAPWDVTQMSREFYEETQPVLEQAPAGYQVNVVSHTMDQMPLWLDEVDRRLLEVSHD
jgi:hypothetical protein